MTWLCRSVPLLVLLTSGCWDMHGRGGDRDAGARPGLDAGPDAGLLLPVEDAGPPPDAGFCDGTLSPADITRACGTAPGGRLEAGVPQEIVVAVDDGCFCGEELRCAARVTGPFELTLDTAICDPRFDCEACNPSLTNTCALPPLEEGLWRVRVGGRDAFELDVWEGGGPPAPDATTVCQTVAPAVEGGLVCPWPGADTGIRAGEVCHPAGVFPDTPFTVEVIDECGGCFDAPGYCTVERSTGPSGNRLVLRPRWRACDCPTCGDCAAVCQATTVTCRVDGLPLGDWAVILEDRGILGTLRSDTFADPDTVCDPF